MVIFHCYVSSPEGKLGCTPHRLCHGVGPTSLASRRLPQLHPLEEILQWHHPPWQQKESYTGRSSERTGKATTGLVDLMGKQGSAISGGSCLSVTCSVDLRTQQNYWKRSEIRNAFPGKVWYFIIFHDTSSPSSWPWFGLFWVKDWKHWSCRPQKVASPPVLLQDANKSQAPWST